MNRQSGRHFLQIPGPANIPDRILRAIARPTIDHRGPEFSQLARQTLDRLKPIFKTAGPVFIYPSSGTGAWEAALVNTLSPGDKVLMFETGYFATLWRDMVGRLGLEVDLVAGDWRHGVFADEVEARLTEDRQGVIKAVAVVHNETSTGVASNIAAVRAAMDRAEHPALLFVDTVSSLACMDYRHDEWGVDVTVAASQKGLMLPPGLGFNAVSDKALAATKTARLGRSYWDWTPMLEANKKGRFPYTPPTNLLFGLGEAIQMLLDEGLEAVFARHARLGEATRRAVRAWDLELQCLDGGAYSNSLSAVRLPEGYDADAFRQVVLERFDMSLGNGLGKVQGKVFRIGHLGDFNDLMLAGSLCGVEMGMVMAGVPHQKAGVAAALDFLAPDRTP